MTIEHSFYSALPAYLGGKRRLAAPILALLAQHLPRDLWRDSHLLDPMSGGGAMALSAKAAGFEVTAADAALRAVIPARALVANSTRRLSRADIGLWFHEVSETEPDEDPNLAHEVFPPGHRAWYRAALAAAARRSDPLRALLELVLVRLVLRTQPMSVLDASDAAASAAGDYDRISSARLAHYLRARPLPRPASVWGIAQQVNRGVFPGAGRALRGDARAVIAETPADVVYLDPPYPGTTTYGKTYRALDELLGDEDAELDTNLTLEALLEAAGHVPLVVISMGGPRATLDALVKAVARHRRVLTAEAIGYAHLPALRKENARGGRFDELVVIAGS